MRLVSLIALLSGAAFSQSETPVNFEIVDVHVSARVLNPNLRGGVLRAGRYELRSATMVDLIRTAYNVEAEKVLGGPAWLETDRFDVIAKTSAKDAALRIIKGIENNEQRILITELAKAATEAEALHLEAPAIIVIGAIVRVREQFAGLSATLAELVA